MWIFNPLNSKPDKLWLWQEFTTAARKRSVNRTQFIGTKSHGIPLLKSVENETELVGLDHLVSNPRSHACYNFWLKEKQ